MNDGTRRLAMLTILGLTLSGCGAAQTSSVATTRPSVPPSGITTAPNASVAPVRISPTVAEIARLGAAIVANPANGDAQRDLGFALLQRVRETADPTLYAPAAAAFEAARAITPDDAQVLVGIGGLELGKHQFAEALATGRIAVTLSPNLPSARAVVVDALVELGRYNEADTASGFHCLRPDNSPNDLLGDGVDANDSPFLSIFPYIGTPHGGYESMPHTVNGA